MKVEIVKPGMVTSAHGECKVGDIIELNDPVAEVWLGRGHVKKVKDHKHDPTTTTATTTPAPVPPAGGQANAAGQGTSGGPGAVPQTPPGT